MIKFRATSKENSEKIERDESTLENAVQNISSVQKPLNGRTEDDYESYIST